MKKIVSLVLAILAFTLVFVSCAPKTDTYKLSIGASVSETLLDGALSATYAAVVTDEEGKIVECRLDSVDLDGLSLLGEVTPTKADKTKYEMGDAYGMVAYGGAKAEWYKQAEFFENYVVGKTVSEVGAIKTKDADLVAGCTIDVSDFVKAIVAAMSSSKGVTFEAGEELTVGLGVVAAAEDNKGDINFIENVAAVVFEGDKSVAAIVDCVDATIEVTLRVPTKFEYKGTKLEQGDAYGMVAYGGAKSEWYAQAQAYANSAVGKTASEIGNLPTEGVAGCTIGTSEMKASIVRAATNNR